MPRGRPRKVAKVDEPALPKRSESYIHTYTRGYFDYLSNDQRKFIVEDGAHALSLLNRFAGHTHKPYSIAKHCIICCEVSPVETKLEALMHDFLEAYICDIPSPLKKLDFMAGYRDYENQQEKLLIKEFKLDGIKPGIISDIDHDMSYLEACAVLNFDKRVWKEPDGLQNRIKQYKKESPMFLTNIETDWPSYYCEQRFLDLFHKYKR